MKKLNIKNKITKKGIKTIGITGGVLLTSGSLIGAVIAVNKKDSERMDALNAKIAENERNNKNLEVDATTTLNQISDDLLKIIINENEIFKLKNDIIDAKNEILTLNTRTDMNKSMKDIDIQRLETKIKDLEIEKDKLLKDNYRSDRNIKTLFRSDRAQWNSLIKKSNKHKEYNIILEQLSVSFKFYILKYEKEIETLYKYIKVMMERNQERALQIIKLEKTISKNNERYENTHTIHDKRIAVLAKNIYFYKEEIKELTKKLELRKNVNAKLHKTILAQRNNIINRLKSKINENKEDIENNEMSNYKTIN